MRLENPKDKGWQLLFQLGPYAVWTIPGEGKYGWHSIVVRDRNPDAPRRSYRLSWSTIESRLSLRPDLQDLIDSHGAFMQQLLPRLRAHEFGLGHHKGHTKNS
jgi:hypothetical protein